MTLNDIPALNAGLNALATLLMTAGFIFIKAGNKTAHRACMLSTGVVSVQVRRRARAAKTAEVSSRWRSCRSPPA